MSAGKPSDKVEQESIQRDYAEKALKPFSVPGVQHQEAVIRSFMVEDLPQGCVIAAVARGTRAHQATCHVTSFTASEIGAYRLEP
jgi:hypothetical protein